MQNSRPRKTFFYRMIFNWPVTIALTAFGGCAVVACVVFCVNFVSCKTVEMTYFGDTPYAMKIPVKWTSLDSIPARGVLISGQNGWRYSIRVGKSLDEAWIHINRLALGGLAAFSATYEITDPEIRHQLWVMASDQLNQDNAMQR